MANSAFHIGIRKPQVVNSVNDGVCELYFLDTIQNKQHVDWFTGEVSEESLLADVIAQVNECQPSKILQHIDSWGGNADVGLGIYNFLKQHPAKVETKILNSCASIATVMAAAGKKITMPRNGFFVIHQASNQAAGTAKDLREAADLCDKYTDNILDVYVQNNRKGKTRDEIFSLISNYEDCWLTGTEAKEWGFVDDCYNDEAMTVTACVYAAKAQFGDKVPQRILNMVAQTKDESIKSKDEAELTNFLNKITMDIKAIVTAAVDKFKGVKVDGITAQAQAGLVTAFQPILNDIASGIENQVKDEITSVQNQITDAITSGVTAGIEAFKAENQKVTDDLTQKIAALTADLLKIQGKETNTPDKPKDEISEVIRNGIKWR